MMNLLELAVPAAVMLAVGAAALIARARKPKPPASPLVVQPPMGITPPQVSTNVCRPPRPVRPVRPPVLPPVTGRPPIQDDLLAIVGFADTAYPILLPTPMSAAGIRARIDQLTSRKYFRGGLTNLAAGIDHGLGWLEKSRGRVRRLVVVSDGAPNRGTELLPGLAERAKALQVQVCSIYAGTGNSAVLQSLADKAGGWHTTVQKLTDLAAAIRRASEGALGGGRSRRRGIVVIVIDTSGSMSEPLAGEPAVSRIEGCRRAIHALLDHHAATYGVNVAA